MGFVKKHIYAILFLLILFFAIGVRFCQLGAVPFGLNTDEAAIGYNAFSILETGKDEHGVPFPLYFKSYGDNKLPVYIYSTAAMIKLFGPTQLAVRVTSALFGVIAVIAIYSLIYVLSKNKPWALCAAFLLAINPWSIFFSRTGFEVNVATTYLLVGTLFFVLWMQAKRFKNLFIVASVVCFLLSAYGYNATRVLSPVIFGVLLIYSYFTTKNVKKSVYVLPVLLFIIGFIPFGISFLKETGLAAQETLLITGGESRAQTLEFRSYISTRPAIIANVLFGSAALYGWHYIKNVFDFFNTSFFFVNGPTHPINGLTNFGMFHLIELLLIPLGIVFAIKRKLKYLYPFFAWGIIVILFGSITREVPHPTRTYAILYPFIIFSSYGLFIVITWIMNQKKWLKISTALLLGAFFAYSILFYLFSYFMYFPIVYAADWRATDQQLAKLIQGLEPEYDTIIIEKNADFPYANLLFYTQYPPSKLHQDAKYGSDGLLTTLQDFGKYHIRELDVEMDKHRESTIIVTSPKQTLDVRHITDIKLPTKKQVLFFDNQLLDILN